MFSPIKFYVLLILIQCPERPPVKYLHTNQAPIIERDVSAPSIEISWSIKLPNSILPLLYEIYIIIDDKWCNIASRAPSDTSLKVHHHQIPDEYKGRLKTSGEGFILTNIQFDIDHHRKFFAKVTYEDPRRGRVYETDEVMLELTHPPEFINFTTEHNILENTPGSIDCIVKSFPPINDLSWVFSNDSSNFKTKYWQLSRIDKVKYGINPKTNLVYKGNTLHYQNVKRGSINSLSCVATSYNGIKESKSTSLDVQYPPDPPSKLEIDLITDREVKIKWLGPPPNTGNPQEILFYTVEFQKQPPQGINTDKSLSNIDPHEGLSRQIIEDDSSEKQEESWNKYNSSSENAVILNLQPSSDYVVRVKAHNGASYSSPSYQVAFHTKNIKYNSPHKGGIRQPILIGIIISATLAALIVMFFAIGCIINLRKKRRRAWAVLNPTHPDLKKGTNSKDHKSDDVLSNFSFKDTNNLQVLVDGFGSLPPPQINQKDFQNYQSSSDIPNLQSESVSLGNRQPYKEDAMSYQSYISNPPVQTQIATKYITPAMSSASLHENVGKEKFPRASSRTSVMTNKSVYV